MNFYCKAKCKAPAYSRGLVCRPLKYPHISELMVMPSKFSVQLIWCHVALIGRLFCIRPNMFFIFLMTHLLCKQFTLPINNYLVSYARPMFVKALTVYKK